MRKYFLALGMTLVTGTASADENALSRVQLSGEAKAAPPRKQRRERDPRDIWMAETEEVAERAFASRDSRNRAPVGRACDR